MTRRFLRGGRTRVAVAAAALMASTLALAACSSGSSSSSSDSPSAGSSSSAEAPTTLRVGFFPNLTHAPAFIALQQGYFKDALGEVGVKVAPTLFNAGPEAVTALFANSIDIAYVGPNPTVQAWTQSKGDAIQVISGAASAGASFVVAKDISSAADLKGKTVSTPQLGNTQDVALKYWLGQQGIQVNADGTGEVTVTNASNSDIVTAFQNGDIAGAWVPEPYAQQLVQSGGKVLVNEKSLWPKGQFVTTNIVVRKEFLQQYPDIVEAFLKANEQALAFMKKDPTAAQKDFNAGLQALTGSSIDEAVLPDAWNQITFTDNPLKATLVESAAHAVKVGLLDQGAIDAAGGFDGLYDLTLLNKVRAQENLPPVPTS
jgi:NitT/TauT family transport system substrate-binding protein